MIAGRTSARPQERFVRECIEATGGNPFLLGELLDEIAVRGFDATDGAHAEITAIVPRGVANTVLLRLARLPPQAGTLARALSVLGDGAQVGDAARLAGLADTALEEALASLVSAGVIEAGGTVRFTHPILRAAIYGDLSAAERERLHCAASKILEAARGIGGSGRGARDADRAGQRSGGGDPVASTRRRPRWRSAMPPARRRCSPVRWRSRPLTVTGPR